MNGDCVVIVEAVLLMTATRAMIGSHSRVGMPTTIKRREFLDATQHDDLAIRSKTHGQVAANFARQCAVGACR